MNYLKLFPWSAAASAASLFLGLYIAEDDLRGEPERTLFFGGVIVGCLNVFIFGLLSLFGKFRDKE